MQHRPRYHRGSTGGPIPTLVTGVAGFIGFHTAARLLADGETVVGVDSIDPYYDVDLKEARLAELRRQPGFAFHEVDLADRQSTAALFTAHATPVVIHLAAQAGVRYSLDHPEAYVASNLVGFANVLEGCRQNGVDHLIYASSSSVYGANRAQPFSEHHGASHPVSVYAATKRANELLAHAYAATQGLASTGLRFFTVYGPWGRPDMALFKFTRSMLAGEPIDVYNRGDMSRDFTYIDDVVEGVVRVARGPAPGIDPGWDAEVADPASSGVGPYRVHNIGCGSPVSLMGFIEVLEAELGIVAKKNLLPMQTGDVRSTHADTTALRKAVGYAPGTPLDVGVRRFVEWYLAFYGDPR